MSSVERTSRPESIRRTKRKKAAKQRKPKSAEVENGSACDGNGLVVYQQECDLPKHRSFAETQCSSYGRCPQKKPAAYQSNTHIGGKIKSSYPSPCASSPARLTNGAKQSPATTSRIPRTSTKIGSAGELKCVTGTPRASHRVSRCAGTAVDISSRLAAPAGRFQVVGNCISEAQRSRKSLGVLKWSQRAGYAIREPGLPSCSVLHKRNPVVYPSWTGPCLKAACSVQKCPVPTRQSRLERGLGSSRAAKSGLQQQLHNESGEAVKIRRKSRDVENRFLDGRQTVFGSRVSSPQALEKKRPSLIHLPLLSSSANESVFDTPVSQNSKTDEAQFLELSGEDLSFITEDHASNVADVYYGTSIALGQTRLSIKHRAIDVEYCKSHSSRQKKRADSVSSSFSSGGSRNTSASKQLSVSEFLERSHRDFGKNTSDSERAITCSDSVKTASTGELSLLKNPLYLNISTPITHVDDRGSVPEDTSGTKNASAELLALSATAPTKIKGELLLSPFCRSPTLVTREPLSPTSAPLVETMGDPRLLGVVQFSPLLGTDSLTPCPFAAPLHVQQVVVPSVDSNQQPMPHSVSRGIPSNQQELQSPVGCDKTETRLIQSATTVRCTVREVAKARITNPSDAFVKTRKSNSFPAANQSTGSCPFSNRPSTAMQTAETNVVFMRPRVQPVRCCALVTVTRIPSPSIIDVQSILLMVERAHNGSFCVPRINRFGFKIIPVGVAAYLLCACFSVLWALQRLHTIDVLYDQYIA